ncbi:F-box protein At5g52880 [Typha latifolia]|uniref:F-box protein At5g52880 n=1 Tax=Typha latifolia TaxID=4733 RepID=UPI003C2F5CD7
MEGGTAMTERYEELGLENALSRAWDYSTACGELGLILRLAYAKLPKSLQSLVFRHTLFAFRILPEVQTGHGVASANILLQAAEAALPKQRKAQAVSEFKHSVVAHKRRAKAHQDGGSLQLPHDVLVHMFGFLDMRSLVAVSCVCWSWNSAANDNTLWKLQYSFFFGNHDMSCRSKTDHMPVQEEDMIVQENMTEVDVVTNFSWQKAFKRKYIGDSSFRFTSNRAFCRHCGLFIWLGNLTCAKSLDCHKHGEHKAKIRPMAPIKVVEYLLGETDLMIFSSDSDDSDSDVWPCGTQQIPKLWAYPKLVD